MTAHPERAHAQPVSGAPAVFETATEIADGSVRFDVEAAPFTGTPSALLTRVKRISAELNHRRGSGTATRTYAVATRQGATGVGPHR